MVRATPLSRLPYRVQARIKTRLEAREVFQSFMRWVEFRSPPRWVFRGQPQKHPLKPSIGRADQYRPEAELLLLQEFKRLALPYLSGSGVANRWDLLALAQHHGLPTRLLDWTTNPLVAFYFATEHSPRQKSSGEVIAVEASKIGYYHPDGQSTPDPFDIVSPGFLYPSAVASRIIAQKGLFSIHPNPTNAWRLRNRTDRFVVPGRLKQYLRSMLFNVGVDAATLMPDLDGLARTLRWRFENRIPFE